MKMRTSVFAVALIALVSFSSGCDAADRDTVAEPSPSPTMMAPEIRPSPSAPTTSVPPWMAAGATHRVAEITAAPNTFIGKTVTVVAEVDEVYGPRAFTLNGSNEDSSFAKGAGKTLLTLVPKVGRFPIVDAQWKNEKARVTGVVQRLVVKDVEREIGWELPANLKSRFKSKPALIARSFERLNR